MSKSKPSNERLAKAFNDSGVFAPLFTCVPGKSSADKLFDIFKEAGRLYEQAGKKRTRNPYPKGTVEYRTFARGQTPAA